MPLSDLRPMVDQALGNRRSTPDIVAGVLRDAIVTGVIRAGEQLNQVELARQFGVSRVPVREAIRLLEAEGLVVSEPHRRTVVSELTPSVLGEIFDVRIYLETTALGAAIPHLTEADFADLESLISQMGRERDHREWMRLNDRFHDALCRPSGKEFICLLIRQLRQSIARYFWSGGHAMRRNQEANAEHRRILESCRARDVARAEEQLENHLRATRAGLTRTLRGARDEQA